jgi:hypothetical protein
VSETRRTHVATRAGSYARVADSSSESLEEGATATKVPRRWTKEETQTRIAHAPTFLQERLDENALNAEISGYEHITGDPVRRPAKRNLVAACYRVHGENFLPLVQRLYAASGTATNLLGTIRCLSPSEAVRLLGAAAADGLDDEETAGASEPEGWLPDLPSSTQTRPDVDPASTPRDNRQPSNSDGGFFSDAELGAMGRSRTAKALSR